MNSPAETPNNPDSKTQRSIVVRCAADIPMKPVDWLWKHWLPSGKLTVLAGSAGTGKTTLALSIAATITNGGQFPDGSHCQRCSNILIWSGEDAADDTLIPRLVASGADLSRCHIIEGVAEAGQTLAFDPAIDIDKLDKEVRRIDGIALLIVDPIVSAVAGDMNRANEVRRNLQPLVDFAERHNCAVLGITHFAKNSNGKSPQDRIIGSQAFVALARMGWVAAKEESGERRVLARVKANIAPDDGGFNYSLRQTNLNGDIPATYAVWEGAVEGSAREILDEVEHDPNEESSALEAAKQFLRDLLVDGPMPAKQVYAEAREAGHARATVNRAKSALGIKSLKDAGSMKTGWKWYLPEEAISRSYSNVGEDAHKNNMSTFGDVEHLQDEKVLESSSIAFTMPPKLGMKEEP